MKCCNKEIKINTGKQDGKNLYWAKCDFCGKQYKNTEKKEVEKYFKFCNDEFQSQSHPNTKTYEIQPIPQNPMAITKWGAENLPALLNQSAQFIDKPATKRMIEKNIRYVSNLLGKSWDKIWQSVEGQNSIKESLVEANYYGATLGEMGDLVPFGSFASFVPNIECYKFALETGNNAPFKDIQIDLIYENDQVDNYQENGDFNFKIKKGIPRGELIAVCVSGIRTDTQKRIGEIYDVERIIEKAKRHSPAYRFYLRQKEEFSILKSEGKIQRDKFGRDCIIEKKQGKYGDYENIIYEDDITNPYEGPDRPEMVRKAAGKSFFAPYMKVRNAFAMAGEWQETELDNRDQAADNVLKQAVKQFDNVEIRDGEIVEDIGELQDGIKTEAMSNKKEVEKTNGKLFND